MRRHRWIPALALGVLGCQWVLGIDEDASRFTVPADADSADRREPELDARGDVTVPAPEEDASCTLAAGSGEVWVAATGADVPEVGTAACPYRTITAALAAVNASSASTKIVHLAPGTYAAGETFPFVLRGVRLEGSGSAVTIIRGSQSYDHSQEGGQFADTTLQATMLVGDATQTTSISGVTIAPPQALMSPTNGYNGLVCDRGNSPDDTSLANAEPNTLLEDVVIGPNYEAGAVVTNSYLPVETGCNLKATRSTFSGNAFGVWVVGCGRIGTGGVRVSLALGDGTEAGGNVFRDNRKEYPGDPNGGRGVLVWDCAHTFEVRRNTFEGNDRGIQIEQNHLDGRNVVNDNLFRNQRYYGIYLVRRASLEQLEGNLFEGTVRAGPNAPSVFTGVSQLGAALRVYQPIAEPGPRGSAIRHARGNRFVNNEVGLLFQATLGAQIAGSDFGTAAAPGNNEFACNSSRQPSFGQGGDVIISSSTTDPFLFRGNTWDHVPPTFEPDGGGPANGLDVRCVVPATVETDAPTLSTTPCAPDFVRGP